MGMFDEIEMEGQCRNCKKKIDYWQTKALDCTLTQYRKGDHLISIGLYIKDGHVHCYEKCGCGTWNDALAIIKDGVFDHIEVISDEEYYELEHEEEFVYQKQMDYIKENLLSE